MGGCANERTREAALRTPHCQPNKLVFGIDYDGTFSADPDGFRAIVALLLARGHVCVLVTGRSDEAQWGAEVRRAVGDIMPIVFAGNAWKRDAAKRAGFDVNVWIDDHPEYIGPQDPATVAMKTEARR